MYICKYVCTLCGKRGCEHVEVREQLAGVSSSIMCVLRIELRLSGLMTSVLHTAPSH